MGTALVTYFGRRNDQARANEVRRSISAWDDLPDAELAQQSKIVIDSASATVNGPDAAAAANFGITPSAVSKVTKARNDFTALIASPQEKIAARKALTGQYRPRFNVVDAFLGELDNLVLQFRESDAGRAMVAAYQASRIIRDLGHGPSEPPPPAPDPAP